MVPMSSLVVDYKLHLEIIEMEKGKRNIINVKPFK